MMKENLFFRDKQENTLKKKKKASDLKAEKAKLIRKKSKQATKDLKKKEKKRKQSLQIHSPNIKRKFKFPNLRDIPENCKHLVNKGDVLYVVPGDGCCGPNCAAALLFGDEIFGPKLRRRMNLFFAKHWHTRYQYISVLRATHTYEN